VRLAGGAGFGRRHRRPPCRWAEAGPDRDHHRRLQLAHRGRSGARAPSPSPRPQRSPRRRHRGPVAPVGHLLDHLVGDPGDGLLRYRGPVDLREVGADLPGGQSLGRKRQHHLVHAGQPPLPLPDDLRLRSCPPGPGGRRCRPGPSPRSAPSWVGCRCAHSRPRYQPGRACHAPGARSSPGSAPSPAPSWSAA
jgi:hypothetical protein